VIVNKHNTETTIIDIAVPGDYWIKEKYPVSKILGCDTRAHLLFGVHTRIHIIALIGTAEKKYTLTQQTAALRSAHILTKVLFFST